MYLHKKKMYEVVCVTSFRAKVLWNDVRFVFGSLAVSLNVGI